MERKKLSRGDVEEEEEESDDQDEEEEDDTEEEDEEDEVVTREYIDVADSPRVSQNESEEGENQIRSENVCSVFRIAGGYGIETHRD